MDLKNIIVKSAETGLNLQQPDGSMPKGHNGPHNDNDTYMRTTAHWNILFLKAYEISKDTAFLKAAHKTSSYLTLPENRPFNNFFFCRKNINKDLTNGLVGQAWIIESLLESYRVFEEDIYLKISKNVFLNHEFDYETGLWYTMNLDGSIRGLNDTLNQQIFFAAVGSILSKYLKNNKELTNKLDIFFDKLPFNLYTYKNGLYRLPIKYRKNKKISLIKNFLNKYLYKNKYYEKELAYHSFVLYGFSLIKKNYKNDIDFFNSKKFKKSLKLVNDINFLEKSIKSKFAYSYNPCGIEIAYALKTFSEYINFSKDIYNFYLNVQLKKHYDFKNNIMNKNTDDENILSSRIYEITRLVD